MKKTKLYAILATAAVVTMGFTACDDNGGTTPPPPTPTDDVLVGSYTGTTILDASLTYTITGPVIVEAGATLTIPAGTQIKAKKGFSSYILVQQGAKININGTADKPVTMTSAEASPKAGDWGGLIINGKAPITGYDPTDEDTWGKTEIANAYVYGGNDAGDNSGVISYLILEYTGAKASIDVEHNGLTLNGVGNGTKIENVYVPNGNDDGIEFFGGSVNVKNLLVVNADDDMFDCTQGWSGTLENAYGVWEANHQSTEKDPRGVEADGNYDGETPDATPQSDFTMTAITIDVRQAYVLDTDPDVLKKALQDAFKIRRGAKATITNALVKGVGHVQDMIDFSDGAGNGDTASVVEVTGELTVPSAGPNPTREINPATGYAGAKIMDGKTGCPTNIFGWTKYTL